MKRAFDLLICILLLVPAAILMALTAVFILTCDGRPLLFSQVRVGLGDRAFRLFKFRSMSNTKRPDGSLLPDGDRLRPWGRALRASSLDELPQLWNVIRGDMSLIGPRPLPTMYLPRYSADQRRRHLVKPGITGWAQVNGRNNLTWNQKFALDLWYVDNYSFSLDLKILWLTFVKVVRRSDISQQGEATMEEFRGN